MVQDIDLCDRAREKIASKDPKYSCFKVEQGAQVLRWPSPYAGAEQPVAALRPHEPISHAPPSFASRGGQAMMEGIPTVAH